MLFPFIKTKVKVNGRSADGDSYSGMQTRHVCISVQRRPALTRVLSVRTNIDTVIFWAEKKVACVWMCVWFVLILRMWWWLWRGAKGRKTQCLGLCRCGLSVKVSSVYKGDIPETSDTLSGGHAALQGRGGSVLLVKSVLAHAKLTMYRARNAYKLSSIDLMVSAVSVWAERESGMLGLSQSAQVRAALRGVAQIKFAGVDPTSTRETSHDRNFLSLYIFWGNW